MMRRYANERRRPPTRPEIVGVLKIGRANAMSISAVVDALPGHPSRRTVRRVINDMIFDDAGVLASPRAGVWMALDADERIIVMDELRETIGALEKRIAAINGGRCALRTCRVDLPKKITRRGGLYCCAEHRYQAAVERDRRHS